jgi:hypothetical protein
VDSRDVMPWKMFWTALVAVCVIDVMPPFMRVNSAMMPLTISGTIDPPTTAIYMSWKNPVTAPTFSRMLLTIALKRSTSHVRTAV